MTVRKLVEMLFFFKLLYDISVMTLVSCLDVLLEPFFFIALSILASKILICLNQLKNKDKKYP